MQGCQIAPAITLYELRHTYAYALINEGVELPDISKLLQHADTRITMRHYAHLVDKTLRAAVAASAWSYDGRENPSRPLKRRNRTRKPLPA